MPGPCIIEEQDHPSLSGRPADQARRRGGRQQSGLAVGDLPGGVARNGGEAVEIARRADQLSGGREPAILGTLAAAYAEAGRFPEALQTARQALDLATQQNKQSLAKSIRAQIRLYESGTPYRESAFP